MFEYTQFMISWLGEEKMAELSKKAGSFKKRSEAVAEYKTHYDKLKQ